MAAFRQVVADFQTVFPAAKFACCLRREIVGEAQKYLCTKSLEQTSPTVPGKRGTQGADALCSDDGNAFGLPGEAEELFVASRIALTDRCEVLVFIAEEEDLAKMPVFFSFNLRDAVQHRTLEIKLHHHADGLGQSGVHTHGKVERTNRAVLQEPGERWQRFSKLPIGVKFGVVAFALRTKDPLHFGVVVKERKEHGDALDDRSAELGL